MTVLPLQALGTTDCAGWEAGAQPFVLKFKVGRMNSLLVTGGSRYTAACMGSRTPETAVLSEVLAAQSSTRGGVAVYAVPLNGGKMSCMTWEAAAQAVFSEFWKYNPAGEGQCKVSRSGACAATSRGFHHMAKSTHCMCHPSCYANQAMASSSVLSKQQPSSTITE